MRGRGGGEHHEGRTRSVHLSCRRAGFGEAGGGTQVRLERLPAQTGMTLALCGGRGRVFHTFQLRVAR